MSADDPGEARAAASQNRRGRPARISRDQIVSAALGVVPEPVTMQAVADALGVDRKSLNYHVGDRETLLSLMATAVFQSEFSRIPPPSQDDWRAVLRWFAETMRRAIRMFGINDTFPIEGALGLTSLHKAEYLLKTLVDAGFEVEQAARATNVVIELALTSARDSLLRAGNGKHPQRAEAIEAIGSANRTEFPLLFQNLVAMTAEFNEDAQWEFNLTVVFAGLTALLQPNSGTA
ncbi:TetR/AcrR family tetracycline transcriptional repressor [Mycobacterium sp. MAA66]|uniref:TetR/AcrR family transcriptional regulator C-terminal domain-containing protein n=1 Tax=Mycobacterium sp. MAA66 TaxID=3156297 RepID=UPI003518DB2C